MDDQFENYYNEFDQYAFRWLENLVAGGAIPKGKVDATDIRAVKPDDLAGFRQCHFFAGIAGWPLALRLAGWPEDLEVWTGSCPCQPFSVAGKRKGTADERHLWPVWRDLIAKRLPPVVFGEQVASADGRLWLSGVRTDMEALGYRFAAADLCAAGVSAPHRRQRLYWVAESAGIGRRGRRHGDPAGDGGEVQATGRGAPRGLADSDGREPSDGRVQRGGEHGQQSEDGGASGLEHPQGDGRIERGSESSGRGSTGGCGDGRLADAGAQGWGALHRTGKEGGRAPLKPDGHRNDGLGHAVEPGLEGHAGDGDGGGEPGRDGAEEAGPVTATGNAGFWSDSVLIPCSDGKARRVKSGLQCLATGVSGRVGKLRAFGNAIVPPLAAQFVMAYREALS